MTSINRSINRSKDALSQPPIGRPAGLQPTRIRALAAAFAARIALLAVAISTIVPFLKPSVFYLVLGGPIVAASLGWMLGPTAWRASIGGTVLTGLAMGLAAEPLGVLVVLVGAGLYAVMMGQIGLVEWITSLPSQILVGVIVAAFVLIITIPAGITWAVGMRALSRGSALRTPASNA